MPSSKSSKSSVNRITPRKSSKSSKSSVNRITRRKSRKSNKSSVSSITPRKILTVKEKEDLEEYINQLVKKEVPTNDQEKEIEFLKTWVGKMKYDPNYKSQLNGKKLPTLFAQGVDKIRHYINNNYVKQPNYNTA